jgi:tRNA (adenine57-N1/adenine58-N1)-methyltransferase catalytic subunit
VNPNPETSNAIEGDIAHLIGPRGKSFIIKLTPGDLLQTHHGMIYHDDLIGQAWGRRVPSHLGRDFLVLQPNLNELLLNLPRATTIMYPKDIGFILVNMAIGPGQRVLEAGSGSGAFTIALAHSVGPNGHVYSYEAKKSKQDVARKNVKQVGMSERVTFKARDAADGFDESGIDALFLDLPNPEDHLGQVREALKPGGFFGSLLPTMNQVTQLLEALEANQFAFVEVCEMLIRYYNPVAERLRPKHRMVAHTGFLTFARPILISAETSSRANAEKADRLMQEKE